MKKTFGSACVLALCLGALHAEQALSPEAVDVLLKAGSQLADAKDYPGTAHFLGFWADDVALLQQDKVLLASSDLYARLGDYELARKCLEVMTDPTLAKEVAVRAKKWKGRKNKVKDDPLTPEQKAKVRNTIEVKVRETARGLLNEGNAALAREICDLGLSHFNDDQDLGLLYAETTLAMGDVDEAIKYLVILRDEMGMVRGVDAFEDRIRRGLPKGEYERRAALVSQGLKESVTQSLQAALSKGVELYEKAKGAKPKELKDLVPDFVAQIPPERITGSDKVTDRQDGRGGWFYDPKTGKVRVNVKGKDQKGVEYRKYGEPVP